MSRNNRRTEDYSYGSNGILPRLLSSDYKIADIPDWQTVYQPSHFIDDCNLLSKLSKPSTWLECQCMNATTTDYYCSSNYLRTIAEHCTMKEYLKKIKTIAKDWLVGVKIAC